MKKTWLAACGLALGTALPAVQAQTSAADQRLRSIYQELVEINTTDSVGDCTAAAKAMGARLKTGGFRDDEMQIVVPPGAPKKGNLVARLKGTGAMKPLLLLAHVDAVEAKREDWERDPFKLVEEGGFFYARASSDDKAMAAIYVSNMIRFKQDQLRPARDLILALTCDEELGMVPTNGAAYLLKNHRPLIDAELALNEGGGGSMDKDGKPVTHGIQAGEKIYQSFQLEVTNKGGHSSVPVPDNAIYRLAGGLQRLGQFSFPFKLSATTRSYFERRASVEPPAVAADMRAILQDPPDPAALTRLYALSAYNNSAVRTTCVATMLDGGHAANALPQRAKAVVNCRILPGEKVADVQATLVRVVADEQIKITLIGSDVESPVPPLTPALMKAIEGVSAEMWPGVPVVPTMAAGATDGRFLSNAGIWTYGVTGLFSFPGGSNAHGLNERLPVKSLYEGHEFNHRLIQRLALP
jgi:acetylornithine deacetylase/succinyl-diaminopimelate desuccinylase-like protein